jgi:murein DD-endopeptidase MepM/ murein hydrolase activator NlpD
VDNLCVALFAAGLFIPMRYLTSNPLDFFVDNQNMEIFCYTDVSLAADAVPGFAAHALPRVSAHFPARYHESGVFPAPDFHFAANALHAAARAVYAARKILATICAAVAAGWFAGFCAFSVQNAVSEFFSEMLISPFAREDAHLLRQIETLDTAMAQFVIPRDNGVDADGTLANSAPASAIPYTHPVTFQEHTVKNGETISSISRRFNLTNISTLISINNIQNARLIRAGQVLSIPSIDGIFYTVRQGDSLAGISAKNNVAVEDILDVNNLDSTVIAAGARLFLPGVHFDADSLKRALGELFTSPLGVVWRLSSGFGPRPDPFTGVRSQHTGIDMVAPLGTSVMAAMSGTVAVASYSSIYGNYVIINHGNGYQTLYGHMQKILVQKGTSVSQGSKIGTVGNTGYSTGPHLHFTVYKNGGLIDPLTVLRK